MPMIRVENGKRQRFFYFDVATTLDELRFCKAFGPGILAALFYAVVSGSMSFVNKVVLTLFSYHFPAILMLSQMIVMSIVLEVARRMGFSIIAQYTFERGRMFVVPSLCFALHTTLALRALDYLSIPMYNVLRRLLPLTSLLFACLMLKKKPSFLVVISVVVVVFGCVIAGFGDLAFNLSAYSAALLSVISQSFYLTFVQKTGVEKGLSTLTVLHTNSINCIPMLMLYSILSGDLLAALRFDGYDVVGFKAALVVDVCMGCLFTYSLFLCTTMNSALTTSLVGVVKGVLTTVIGFFTFGGVYASGLIVVGIILNSFGGFMYSYAKYTERVTMEIEKHFCQHTVEVELEKPSKTTDCFKSAMHLHSGKHPLENGYLPHNNTKVNDTVIEMGDAEGRRITEHRRVDSNAG